MINIYYGMDKGKNMEKIQELVVTNTASSISQFVIVPETKTFEMEKTMLTLFKSGGNPYIEVFSQSRFGKRILGKFDEQTFVDDGGRVLLVKRAVEMSKTSFIYYKDITFKVGFYEKLLVIFDELRASRVDAVDLINVYESGQLLGNIHDIAIIYAVYRKEIEKIGPETRDILYLAAKNLGKASEIKGADIHFYGFTGFTKSEYQFIEELMKHCGNVYFYFATDGRDSLFAEQNKSINRVEKIAGRTGKDVIKGVIAKDCCDKATDFLREHLYSFENVSYKPEDVNVSLIKGATPKEECMLVAAEIRRLSRECGIRYNDIAVSSGDVEGYSTVFEEACALYDISVFSDDRRPVLTKPILMAALGALKAVIYNFTYESMFNFLKTGLVFTDDKTLWDLENYVITWNIAQNKWRQNWERSLWSFAKAEDEEKVSLENINNARKQIIEPLLWLKEQTTKAKIGREYVEALLGYLKIINFEYIVEQRAREYYASAQFKEALEYEQIFDILINGCEQFVSISGQDEMSLKEFSQLFSLVVSSYDVASIPAAIDRIVLSDMRNLPLSQPQVLFVLGCNEGVLLPTGTSGGLISEKTRIAMSDMGVELSLKAEERQIELESHILLAFSCPKDRLYIGYSEKSVSGDNIRAAYLLERVKQLLPNMNTIVGETQEHLLDSESTIRSLAAVAISGDNSPVAKSALKYMSENNSTFIADMTKTIVKERGPIRDEKLILQLYGNEIKLSASRIERANNCHFSYFCQYGIKVKARKPIKVDAAIVGSFLHELVENAVKAYIEDENCDISKIVKEHGREYIMKIMGGEEMSGKLRVILENIVKNALEIIENILDELKLSEFKPMFCEFSFSHGGDAAPLTFKSRDVSISVGGKIDRVDAYTKNGKIYLKIVDYKSGRKSFDLSELLYGLNVQMFLYMMMLKEAKQIRGVSSEIEKESAAVLYVPLRNEYKNADFDSSDEEKTAAREGYVIDEKEILDALERPKDGKYKYLPVSIKKDGDFAVKSSIMSAVEFGNVFNRIRKDLQKLADRIICGEISATPVKKGLELAACTYCEYHSICRFEEGVGNDAAKSVVKLPKAQVLSNMEEK